MRAFDELSEQGRIGRLRLLASDSLREDFDIDALRVSLLASHSFNTLFRADLVAGPSLAVRVGEVRIHADGVEEVEAAWLDALHADTEIRAPRLFADRHGRHVTARHQAGVPGRRYCSVMTWVPGRRVRERFDHLTSQRMGVLLANIHDHAASYRPPVVPAGIHADRVVYFADTSRLGEYESEYGSMFVEAVDRVHRHLDALWAAPPHRPHLLHGDFGPQNVMRWRSLLAPIDFQDLQFGFDVQDVGITVADLRRVYDDEALVDALVAGYESVRRWPLTDQSLARALDAARSLNVINLGLNLRRPGLAEFIDRHAQRVAGWMGLSPRATLI
ncbi:MAG: phosphotransferase [Ilumatobacteraceae bacterium]